MSLRPSHILREDRLKGCLFGFFIGDALAMPVHWYYDLRQLRHDFGQITKYEAPKPTFPGSIMNLSNTGGGGRGSDQGDIVGSVILHGKKKFWLKGGQYHYHHGMQAGENTLDALVTLVLMKSVVKNHGFIQRDFVSSYIEFMTTPGSHNDTYAGTCHRMFFKNLVAGRSPEHCPDNDSHNVDAIDALMIIPPIVVAMPNAEKAARDAAIAAAIKATRNSTTVLPYAFVYGDMLSAVSSGFKTVQEAAIDGGSALGLDVMASIRRGSSDPMTACYITSSFPAMLFFAAKYGGDTRQMLLASANAGGENVARGSLLGALGGAATGFTGLPDDFVSGLVLRGDIERVTDAIVANSITDSCDAAR